MNAVKKVFLVIFAIICFLYVFIVASTCIFHDFYPFGIRVAIVSTDSMSPVLNADDFVVIRKTSQLAVGDIVVFTEESTNNEVIHRIIEVNGDYIVTKGDANINEDNPVHKKLIKGRLLWKSTTLGRIISYMMNPYVFSVLITIFLITLILPSNSNENK